MYICVICGKLWHISFVFRHHTFPYTVRILPSTSILFDRTIQVPPSLNPHFSAFSSPPTSICIRDRYRYGRYCDFVHQPVIQKQSSNLLTVSHHRTVTILFYSLQFCHYIPCNELHSFILSQFDSIVRYSQSLFRYNWLAQVNWYTYKVICFISIIF